MASPQIRVTPEEAITQMTTIRGRLEGAGLQGASPPAGGMDPHIAAAVQGQTQASQHLITTVSDSADKSATGATALGEQDKVNQARLRGVDTSIDNGVRPAGGAGSAHLPQGGAQMLSNGPAPQSPLWPQPPAPNPSTFPESTLDGVHGTGTDDVNHITVIPKNPDGSSPLGPASVPTDPTVQVAPPSSPVDVWMPRSETSGNLWWPTYPGELAPSNYEQVGPDLWWRRGTD